MFQRQLVEAETRVLHRQLLEVEATVLHRQLIGAEALNTPRAAGLG